MEAALRTVKRASRDSLRVDLALALKERNAARRAREAVERREGESDQEWERRVCEAVAELLDAHDKAESKGASWKRFFGKR